MIGPMADPLKGAEKDQLCFTVQWLHGGEPVPNVHTDMEFFPRMSYTLEEVVTLVEHTGCGSGRLQGAHMCVRLLEDPADAITDRPVGLYPPPKCDHESLDLAVLDPSTPPPLTDQERADIAELAGRIHDRLLNSRRLHSGESQASDYIMASWTTTLRYITTVLHAVPPPVTVHRPGSVAGLADLDSMRSATPSPNEEMLEIMMTPNEDLR